MSYFGIPIRNGIGIGLRSYVGLDSKNPPWTPAQLSTALWLDAADTSTITLSGPRVSQWADKSGNGRNATQGVAANQPGWGVGRNLLAWSESITTSPWVFSAPITPDAAIAPDGTLTADRLDTSLGSVYQIFTCTPSTTYTFSFYARLGTLSANDFVFAVRDDTAGVFIGVDIVPNVTLSSDAWQRVTYTFTTPVGCTLCRVYPFRSRGPGAGSGTCFLWGSQANPGATADKYQQTTSGAQPLAAGMNGLPTLAFDGTNDLLALPNGTIPSGDSNYTMFICMELGTLANTHFVGTSPSGAAATGNWIGIISGNTVGNWWLGYGVSGGVTQVGQDIYGAWYDSSLSTAYFARNGGTVFQNTLLVDRNSLTTQQWIGANGTALTQYLQGKIAEIIVTGSTISTDNQQRIEGYFAWKWGLTAKLPSNHPYKNHPPTI